MLKYYFPFHWDESFIDDAKTMMSKTYGVFASVKAMAAKSSSAHCANHRGPS